LFKLSIPGKKGEGLRRRRGEATGRWGETKVGGQGKEKGREGASVKRHVAWAKKKMSDTEGEGTAQSQ